MRRRGFTIVELLMVVAVISVLLTIVMTAARNSIHSSRSQRTKAMQTALQASIATWQATDSQGHWPGAIQNAADNGETCALSQAEAQHVFRLIVQRSTGESGTALPLIDPHGLYVAPSGAQDGRSSGLTFDAARRGDRRSQRKLRVAEMEFGYQGEVSGKFYHFNIIYHAASDSVTVSTCCERCIEAEHGCKDGNCEYCHKRER